ncbi:MAG: site-specific integrase [Sphingobium sp.]|nr:site-specific integrase [Sphingobium sp.]
MVAIDEARALLLACDRAGGPPIVRMASRFLALTAVRMGALLGARWSEFEQLDGDAPIWRIPAARMKIARAKKDDAAHDHLVPLSRQAVEVLRQARDHFAGRGDMIFPIHPAAIGALYKRAGFAGRHVPHGWRASFSTILNEQFPLERGAIDMALAHVPADRSKVERAYNRSEMLEQRRSLFDRWGAMLNT